MRKHLWLTQQLLARMKGTSWPAHGLMPTTRELAAEYGLSLPTVQMALRHLRDKRHLEPGGPRERYYVRGVGALPEETGAGAAGLRFHRVAAALLDDVATGVYEGGVLPSAKELKERYRCSHATLRKAVRALNARGILTEGRRSIEVATMRLQPRGGSRVCLTGPVSLHSSYHGHALPFVRSLERECHVLGWGPPLLHLTNDPLNHAPPRSHQVAGYIHVLSGAGKEWLQFHHRTTSHPLVIVDMQESMRGRFAHKTLFRLVPDNRRAGTEIARVLWDLGHRRATFLAPSIAGQRWSEYRLEGVRDIFEKKGGALTVRDLSEAPACAGSTKLEAGFARMGALRAALVADGHLPAEMVKNDYDRVYELSAQWRTALAMDRLFEDALSARDSTAWVLLNDDLAAIAVAFLRRHGLRPGRDVSVAGFDNSPLSYHMGITSYDFAMDRMAPLALRCLQYPAVMAAQGTSRHVAGQVVVRGSTARR